MSSTDFGPPFDHDDADLILRNSDRVNFHVYQAILSASSPFFKSMCSLIGTSEKANGLINLPENSRTVSTLLTCIYSVSSTEHKPESLDGMMYVFVAAKKYNMALVSQFLNQELADSERVQDNPIAAFCAAYSLELGETCRIAAKASLKCRMNLNNAADKLQYMNGPAFYQLYKFHRACSAAAAQATSDTDLCIWITKSHSTWWDLASREGTCKCVTYRYTLPYHYASAWPRIWVASSPYHNFITRTHKVLLEHPCREAVTGHQFLAPSYKVEVCDHCRLTLLALPEFSRLLGDEIERRISEVRHYSMISTKG
jgi:hypothetical protein